MSALLTIAGMLLVLVLFDAVALLWGVDSRDGPDSPEWERRRGRPAAGPY